MTPEQRFLATLTKLAAVYRLEVDDVLVEAYWEAFRDWAPEALEGGARAIIRDSRFFPRPVEWADAAEAFMRERVMQDRSARLALPHSTEPPIRKEDVDKIIESLGQKLGWPGRA